MLSNTELRIVRDRKTRTFNVARDAVFVAGYREFVSKRLGLGKLIGTLVRQASQELSPVETAILAAVSQPDLSATSQFHRGFQDFRRFVSSTLHASAVLDLLFEELGDAVLICAGSPAPFARIAHEDLTRSLKAHHRRYESEVAEQIMGWEEPRVGLNQTAVRRIVVEDKPGKPYILNLEESTLKQSSRKWQHTVRTGDAGAYPADIVEGWAAIATVLKSKPDSGASRTFRSASVDICCSEASLDLRQLANIVSFAEHWVETVTGFSITRLRNIGLNIPSAAITGYLRRELLSRHPKLSLARFDFAPFALGWHPVRSLFELISRRDLPSLLINTSDYPIVNFLACWQ